MIVVLFLVACRPAFLDAGTEEVADASEPDPSSELPGGTITKDEEDGEELDKDEFGCSPLFDQEHVVIYDVTIADEHWRHLESEWRTADGTKDYVPVETLLVDGVEVPHSMMRLKGNNGCCWVGEKMQFVLAFNEVDEDARHLGQRKVALDSPYYEPTVLKNRLANWYMFRAGLPAACTNSAVLNVNGEYFGLYANMEEMDREFLERSFGKDNADGDLWKYGTVLDNHEDEEIDTTRITDFWASYDPATMTTMGDSDQWMDEWAVEAILPDGDGYWCCGHNYYLYDHPERGFLWVPWDKDGTFDWIGYDTDPGYLWYPTYTPHMAALLQTDDGWKRYTESIVRLTQLYATEEMQDAYQAMVEQTEPYGSIDPHRYYDDATYAYYIDDLRTFLPARRSYLDVWAEHNAE